MKRKLWISVTIVGVLGWFWVGSYVYLRAKGTHTMPASPGGGPFGGPPTPAVTSVIISVPRSWETTCRYLFTPLVKLDRSLTGTSIIATWNPAFCHGGEGG